jgi:hypothetical protein
MNRCGRLPTWRSVLAVIAHPLMHRLRSLGIDIQPARNTALHDLTKEIDAASLADLLGYSAKIMNIHAARAAVPMATYPALKRDPR